MSIRLRDLIHTSRFKCWQTHHRQLTGAEKPEIIGPSTGPNVVAAMKQAIATPLDRGLVKISAYSPPSTAIGADAKHPHMNLKTKNAVQLGDSAVANVKIVYDRNATRKTTFLP